MYNGIEMATNLLERIDVLADGAAFDVCAAVATRGTPPATARGFDRWLYPAVMPGGRVARLFKVLLSNACENNCLYCANRRDANAPRTTLTPEELVRAFLDLHSRGKAEGLFLSSGLVGGATRTMDRMLSAVEQLRGKHDFRGYIHLKILPETEAAAVARAVELADRVSINLEAPGPPRLGSLAREKDYAALEERLRWVSQIKARFGGAPAGVTTQFVVGAAGETDAELIRLAERLYTQLSLARVYYSAFKPLAGTPLEHLPATPLKRQVRLYQADFLVHNYGYRVDELVLTEDGNLPLSIDPKEAWARAHPEVFPVELNAADRRLLLRIPGIGPIGASRIIAARRRERLRHPDQLRNLGIPLSRCAPYILLAGRRAGPEVAVQLPLWR